MSKILSVLEHIAFVIRKKTSRVKRKAAFLLMSLNGISKTRQAIEWPYSISEMDLLARIRDYNKQKPKRKAKVVCYTYIDFQNNDLILPEWIVNEWDYVVFTDRKTEGEHIFEVREPTVYHPNPHVISMYLKTHPHQLFPQYQYTIWLDSHILVKGKCLMHNLHRCMQQHSLLMLAPHPTHPTMRLRLDSALQSKEDKEIRIAEQINTFFEKGLPETSIFYDTGIIVRHNQNTTISKAGEAWWDEVIHGGKSDPLSLSYILWKFEIPAQLMQDNYKSACYHYLSKAPFNTKNVRPYISPSFFKVSEVLNHLPVNKAILKPAQKNTKPNIIDELKTKLYNYGFTGRAISELKNIAKSSEADDLKKNATLILAGWYANLKTVEGAKICLNYLNSAQPTSNQQIIKKWAILKAESYKKIGENIKAQKVLNEVLKSDTSAEELLIARAGLAESSGQKIFWLNKVYGLYNLSQIALSEEKTTTDFERLSAGFIANRQPTDRLVRPKVTVIVTAYNAQHTLHVAINSLIHQTWKNIEIIVVDDCSTDGTALVAEAFQKKDSRIRLIKLQQNMGTYVARNYALREATGEFVTCHDADDWSHPEKTEIQVNHLMRNTKIIANTSRLIKVTKDLAPQKLIINGPYLIVNHSSFMFRKKEVMAATGYWDSVRFGADGEMIYRIKKHFGNESVAHLLTGPLMLSLVSDKSLTGKSAFGIQGFKKGARVEYDKSYINYIENTGNLYYGFSPEKRKFAVPVPLQPISNDNMKRKNHFDIIYAFDFRFPDDFVATIVQEISSKNSSGAKTGIFQLCSYNISATQQHKSEQQVRKLIDDEKTRLIVFGEKVSCEKLIIKHPAILMDYQHFIPEIDAKEILIEKNHPTKMAKNSDFYDYDKKTCDHNVFRYFQKQSTWID